jgi:hypothetical protein
MKLWIDGPSPTDGHTRSEMKRAAILMIFMTGFMLGTMLMLLVAVSNCFLTGACYL